MRDRPPLPSLRRVLLAAAAAALLPGCVTVYQPLAGLQRPVVLSTEAGNFEGQRILVRCLPGDASVPRPDVEHLCRNLRTVLSSQGAEAQVDVLHDGHSRSSRDEGEAPPDLIVEVSSRLLHQASAPILSLFSVLTATLVPMIEEFTFAQDVTVRDGEGTLLASDSLQGRFIQYIGVGVWAVNGVVDLAVRQPGEKINDEAIKQDFSRDLYGQISQLTLHAMMRERVLRGFPAAAKKE